MLEYPTVQYPIVPIKWFRQQSCINLPYSEDSALPYKLYLPYETSVEVPWPGPGGVPMFSGDVSDWLDNAIFEGFNGSQYGSVRGSACKCSITSQSSSGGYGNSVELKFPFKRFNLYIYEGYTEFKGLSYDQIDLDELRDDGGDIYDYYDLVGVPKKFENDNSYSKRGTIKGFSPKSRTRMIKMFNRLDQEQFANLWIDLTYSDDVLIGKDINELKDLSSENLRRLQIYIDRSLDSNIWGVWRREWEDRKSGEIKGTYVPHFHLLIRTNENDKEYIAKKIIFEWLRITGTKNPKAYEVAFHKDEDGNYSSFREITDTKMSQCYVSKYVAKTQSLEIKEDYSLGRMWGKFGPMPFKEKISLELSRRHAVILFRTIKKSIGSKISQIKSNISELKKNVDKNTQNQIYKCKIRIGKLKSLQKRINIFNPNFFVLLKSKFLLDLIPFLYDYIFNYLCDYFENVTN